MVLLCFAAGAVFAMTSAPRVITRVGAGRPAAIAAALFGLCIIAVGLTSTIYSAAMVAAAAGVCFGGLDVTMNSEAAVQERQAGKPVMAFFHAMFSFGTLVAALGYAALTWSGLEERLCLLAAGAVIFAAGAAGWVGMRRFNPLSSAVSSVAAAPVYQTSAAGRVCLLGGLTFLSFFAEGAILDWIAVFVVRVVGSTESTGALAYGVFACAMTLGRFGGDKAKRRFGAGRLFRVGALAVAVGFLAVLVFPTLPVIFVAMAICGLGVANLVPILFSEAGTLGGGANATAMARVMTLGYAGILIGPAMIGFLARSFTLHLGLVTVVVALCVVALNSRALRQGA